MAAEPTIYTDHPLSTDLIDPDAIKIVRRLRKFGFEAYLVGGCVRDLVLGIEPKDFDVATSATPREVRSTFRNCRVIGRRFRLCHIFFQSKIIEVATFRTEPLSKLEEDAPERAEEVARELPQHPPPIARPAPPERGPAKRARDEGPERGPRKRSRDEGSPPAVARPPRVEAPGAPPAAVSDTLGGLRDDEWRSFAAGIIEVPPAPAAPPPPIPPPIPPEPAAIPREPPVTRSEAPREARDEPKDDRAPWEFDDEAGVREEQAIAGRRAVVREEVAEAAAEVEEAADEVDEDLVDGVFEDMGAPSPDESADREDKKERLREGFDARQGGPRRERRKARWERLLEEEPAQSYGTAEEDARLRDFTINALFYDPVDDRIIDFVEGMRDLRARVLRTIGEPVKRMVEDPVRILRAVKSAAKLDLEVERATYASMVECAPKLAECAPRRILEEILKLLASGAAARSFRLLAETRTLRIMLPELERYFPPDGVAHGAPLSAVPPSAGRTQAYRYLEALDRMPKAALTPSVLVAALFYEPILNAWREAGIALPGEEAAQDPRRFSPREALAEEIADAIVKDFSVRHSLSKAARAEATRIVLAQRLLRRRSEKRMRAAKLVSRDWFDAALALLRIAVAAEGADDEVCRSWEGRAAAVRAGEEEPVEEDKSLSRRRPAGESPPTREGAAGGPPRFAAPRLDPAGDFDAEPGRRRRRGRRGGRGRGGAGPRASSEEGPAPLRDEPEMPPPEF